MIEVEVKLAVTEMGKLEEKLQNLGFTFLGRSFEEDIYFNHPFHDFRSHDQALRIRKSRNPDTGEEKSLVTFKGAKLDSVTMSRTEEETEIGDGKVFCRILEAAGFVPVLPVRKERLYYGQGRMHICLDRVEQLGTFMEVEILTEEESRREEAVKEIGKILGSLGYSMEDTTRVSYLSMLEKESGF